MGFSLLCLLVFATSVHAEAILLPLENRPALSDLGDRASCFETRRARLLDRLEAATEDQAKLLRRRFAALDGLKGVEPLWLVHALRITGTAEAIATVRRQWAGRAPAREARASRRTALDESPTATSSDAWNLERIRAPTLWQRGYVGQGVRIAVLDGGFDLAHGELARPSNDGWDFVTNAALGPDRDGHGTAAAGIAAGASAGVAPESSLYFGRVCCDDDDTLFETTVWKAVQAALRKNVRVISMSLGVKAFEGPNYALWRRAGAVVLAADALWIVSAGNRPDDPLGAPASNPPPWALGGGHEDARTATIAVGATDREDASQRLSAAGIVRWVAIAPYFDFLAGIVKPDLCAPSDVRAPKPGGGFRSFAGTSAATPHVAGIAALLWSARPQVTADRLAEALRVGAKKVSRCGAGRLDALESLNWL